MTVRSAAAQSRPASPVGQLLQYWRQVRHMSQLALASAAQVTPRHVSFVETGRARPSRDMVLTLARTLDVPLRGRNQMLLAAGYAPVYHESELGEATMDPVRAAVERMLSHHEPFPAVVLDRYWNVMLVNDAAQAMFRWLLGPARAAQPANVIRLMFDPDGLRPYVTNWADVGRSLIERVRREAVGGTPDENTVALLAEALAQPGVPPRWRTPDYATPLTPVVPVQFGKDRLTLHYFSMVTTVGTPQDVTAQEIRVESFFPVDEATGRHRWPGTG